MSTIETNSTVVLYPSFGHLLEDGRTWRLTINGTISQQRRLKLPDRMLLRLLRKLMQVENEALESEIFRQRIAGFISKSRRGLEMTVRIGSRLHVLNNKTKRHGYFCSTIDLDIEEIKQLEHDGKLRDGWLDFHVESHHNHEDRMSGRVQLIENQGVSIISDIDDTIKHTEVPSRREMLVNTFLREFRPIDGMAELFRCWAEQGAAFHFVSSSPSQLYHHLADLCQRSGFPQATFHLPHFRLRDQMLRKVLLISRRKKIKTIKQIFGSFRHRQFVLIGDSGERDPELYSAVARRFPNQVTSILIREISERPMDPERLHRISRQLPPGMCKVFQTSSDLSNSLPNIAGTLQCQ